MKWVLHTNSVHIHVYRYCVVFVKVTSSIWWTSRWACCFSMWALFFQMLIKNKAELRSHDTTPPLHTHILREPTETLTVSLIKHLPWEWAWMGPSTRKPETKGGGGERMGKRGGWRRKGENDRNTEKRWWNRERECEREREREKLGYTSVTQRF